jgi:hypothetical protein
VSTTARAGGGVALAGGVTTPRDGPAPGESATGRAGRGGGVTVAGGVMIAGVAEGAIGSGASVTGRGVGLVRTAPDGGTGRTSPAPASLSFPFLRRTSRRGVAATGTPRVSSSRRMAGLSLMQRAWGSPRRSDKVEPMYALHLTSASAPMSEA